MSAIFLSYSSADVADAVRVRDLLMERGYASVFRDKDPAEGIVGGTRWAQELFASLERADVVVFLATPRSLASPWCHTELAVAVSRGRHVVQIMTSNVAVHPVLADRQAIGPIPDVVALVGALVDALTRVGRPPGDPFTWDVNESPYPGLRRLTEKHAAVLFGRDREIATITERLIAPTAGAVLVTGPSGSGKSSLVRAGVIPRLRLQEGTIVLPSIEPGPEPLRRVALAFETLGGPPVRLAENAEALAEAVDRTLAAEGGRIVVFLDQAEDLLDRADRADVVRMAESLGAADPARLALIVALRSASLDAWLREPHLASLVAGDPVWVRPLDRPALREIVVRPARLANIRFEPPELVERIVDDAGDGRALPLLAALMEELTREHSRTSPAVVTAERYDVVGPVGRIVERRARAATEDVQRSLGLTEPDAVDAYLRLVEINDEGQPIRAEAPVDTLPRPVAQILAAFERHRLVIHDRAEPVPGATGPSPSPSEAEPESIGTGTYTPVHEEVFRAWPALAAAIDARRADLRTRSWLRRDAETWEATGRGHVPLTGGRLEIALDWARRSGADLTPAVRSYLATATAQRQRRRLLTAALPVLAAVALFVGAIAAQQLRGRTEAEALRLAGEARAAFDSRPDLGLLLALEAAARSDDPQVEATLMNGLSRGPGPAAFAYLDAPVESAALDAAGSRALLAHADRVVAWDVGRTAAAGVVPVAASAVAISPDGGTIAIGRGRSVDVLAWPGTSLRVTCDVAGDVTHVRLSEGGNHLLAVSTGGGSAPRSDAVVMAAADCAPTILRRVDGLVRDADMDADGARVALASEQNVDVWDSASGAPYDGFEWAPSTVVAVDLEDDTLAGVTDQGDVLLWTVRTPAVAPVAIPALGSGGVRVRLRPGLDSLLAVSEAAEMHVVTPGAQRPVGPALQSLPTLDYRGTIRSVALASAGDRAVTVESDGRVVEWDLGGGPALANPLMPDEAPGAQRVDWLRVLADGTVVAAGGDAVRVMHVGGTTRDHAVAGITRLTSRGSAWAVATRSGEAHVGGADGQPRAVLTGLGEIGGVAALADGGVAAAARDGTITVVTQAGVRSATTIADEPTSLGSDGRWLFVGTLAGGIVVLDATNLAGDTRRITGHRGDVSVIEVAPDGRTIASGSDDRAIAVWTSDGRGGLAERRRLVGHEDRVRQLTFTSDSRWLASAGEDRRVILWDLASGEQFGDAVRVEQIPGLAFATGERQLLVGTDAVDRWDLRPAAWRTIACRIVGSRPFGSDERQRYLGGGAPVASCREGND